MPEYINILEVFLRFTQFYGQSVMLPKYYSYVVVKMCSANDSLVSSFTDQTLGVEYESV